MTIRRRLLLMLLGPLTLLLSFGIALDYTAGAAPLRAAFDEALGNEAVAVAAKLQSRADGSLALATPRQSFDFLRPNGTDTIWYAVRGPAGQLLGGEAGLPFTIEGRRNPTFHEGDMDGQRVRAASYRITGAGGNTVVTVAETTNKRESARRRMLVSIIVADVAQFTAILALVWVGVRVGLRPLLALRAQIDSRSARDLAPLDESGVPGEVQPLTHALNQLFATVQATAQGQLQFLASAAHQLRTPLAGLQTQIELLQDDPQAQPLRARLASLLDGTRRLAHTSNQLLALARAEPSAAVAADFHAVDLRELAEDAVAQQFDAALRRRIDLGVEASAAQVTGSAWLLRELLANLVDNALAYTPAEGRVTVRCGHAPDASKRPFIEVEDDGPGIAESEREHVLERFYRAPGTPGDGCGLGLAIVHEIARAHHAEVHISGGPQQRGTCVRVLFP